MKSEHIPLYPNTKQPNKDQLLIKQTPNSLIKPAPLIKHRQTRSDKCHDVKFPITTEEKIRLKIALKQADFIYKRMKGFDQRITQTSFNTSLLRYSLNVMVNKENFVLWDRQYADSPTYMHTKPNEYEYREIGGIYGLSTTKGLSDRKTVYCLIMSALEWMEGKGDGKYEDVLRFLR